jgi:hypothetical protein
MRALSAAINPIERKKGPKTRHAAGGDDNNCKRAFHRMKFYGLQRIGFLPKVVGLPGIPRAGRIESLSVILPPSATRKANP